MMANNAARNLGLIYGRLSKSTERLSSGLRINSAGDDAAGLAIRELMRSDIAVMQQGIRNAHDGISMIQTAEGAMAVIDEKLTRMKELAEQAATGTYTTVQREIINSEYQAMAREIDRIANATDFNQTKLLDGSISAIHGGSGMKIHFGTGNDSDEDYYFVTIGDVRATTQSGLKVGGDAKNDIWGTAGTGTDGTVGSCCGGGITSLTAPVADWSSGQVFAYGYNWDHEQPTDAALNTGKYIGGMYQMSSGASLQDLIDKVNVGTQSRVRIDFSNVSAANLASAGTGEYFRICLDDDIYVWGSADAAAVTNKTSYLMAGAGSAHIEFMQAVNSSGGNFWAMRDGNSGTAVWVFARDGGDYDNWLACDEADPNHSSGSVGSNVKWYNPETEVAADTGTTFALGGEKWGLLGTRSTPADNFGVVLSGRDVGAERDLRILNFGATGAYDVFTGSGTGLTSATNLQGLNRDAFSELQNAADGLWEGAHIRTQSAAQEALSALDAAILHKDVIRANLGAIQNRLENTITNMQIQAENLQAAESRISDVDVATEMTEFTRNNILAQAATSMLAQANSLPQLALSLMQ
jgi:flagellin